MASTTSRTGSEIDTATIIVPRRPTRTEISDSTTTGISMLAVFSMIQPCVRMTTTTAMLIAGRALVISHQHQPRHHPGAVSRPVRLVAAATIGRIGRWISSSAAPIDVDAPKSMDIAISQTASGPPSRLTANSTNPPTVQMVASSADW